MTTARATFIAGRRERYERRRQEMQKQAVALALLRQHLSGEQLQDFSSPDALIRVRGSNGGKYIITYITGNYSHVLVQQVLQCGLRPLCISALAPDNHYEILPWPDEILAFKLAIETNERSFRRIVNNTGAWG